MNKKTETNKQERYFKITIFLVLIISTIIINLGYIQSRDSSKDDFLYTP